MKMVRTSSQIFHDLFIFPTDTNFDKFPIS
jgi:hypothetical protein